MNPNTSLSFLDTTPVVETPPAPRSPSPLTLLGRIWVHPRATLEAVHQGKRWLSLVPLLLLVMLLAGRVIVEAPHVTELRRQAYIEQLRQRLTPQDFQNLPPEALQGPPAQPIALGLLAAIGPLLLAWVVRAGFLHLLGLAFGGQNSYGSLFSTAAWASMPLLARALLQIIFITVTQSPIVGGGLSGLAASAEEALAGSLSFGASLLSSVDLFALWYIVLLGLAMQTSGRLSRNKAIIITLIYAALSMLVSAAPSLLLRAFSQGM